MNAEHSSYLETLVSRINEGEKDAIWELLECTHMRLRGLAGKILRVDFPRVRQGCLYQTTDLTADLRLKLAETLVDLEISGVKHFFRLAAKRIRWLLLDVLRNAVLHDSMSSNDFVGEDSQVDCDILVRLLELIQTLPAELYEVVDLHVCLGWPKTEVARQLEVNERTVRRRLRRAYSILQQALSTSFPELEIE